MESLIYVGVGGFLGANARYLMSLWTNEFLAQRWGVFPYGTLIVNVLGSIGLALFGVWLGDRTGMSSHMRLLVGTGFFGAFTTFSTFANESITLMNGGGVAHFLLNVILNNLFCLLGVVIGLLLGQRLFGTV